MLKLEITLYYPDRDFRLPLVITESAQYFEKNEVMLTLQNTKRHVTISYPLFMRNDQLEEIGENHWRYVSGKAHGCFELPKGHWDEDRVTKTLHDGHKP